MAGRTGGDEEEVSFFKRDNGEAYKGKGGEDAAPGFAPTYPTESKGDGRVRPNNIRTGAGQGAGTVKRKVRCKQCGFLMDLSKNDYSGGSLDGAGAGGAISKTTNTVTLTNGDTLTEYTGDQRAKKGAGCPMCFSKNGANVAPGELEAIRTPPVVGF